MRDTESRAQPGTPEFFRLPIQVRLAQYAPFSKQPGPVKVDPTLFFKPEEIAFFGGFAPSTTETPATEEPPFNPFAGLDFSGPGGGTTIGAPTLAPQPQLPLNIAEAREYIRHHYGMYAFLLDDPTVAPLLEQAAMEGWPDDRVESELRNTDWWKNSTDSQRKWDILANTDPGTAKQTLDAALQSLRPMFARYNIPFDNNPRALEMAFNVVRMGWDESQVRRGLVSELTWDPASGVSNPLGNTTVGVMKMAGDYAMPMSLSAAFDKAKALEIGDIDELGLEQQFRDQASLNYAWWAPDLATGATVRQLADPYIQTYSNLLEVSPADIDLTDPRFQQVFTAQDQTGQRSLRTLHDARTLMMSDPGYGWDRTDNARGAALGLVQQLAKTFGQVA